MLKRTSSLYLDVWKPANATADSALPVRVWIYGGANSAGGISDPLYDGCNIASGDALLVSINYRLGPLGFLALDSAGIAGNQATQDILLALEWVQENIAAFGGDPVSGCAETPPSCDLHVANVTAAEKSTAARAVCRRYRHVHHRYVAPSSSSDQCSHHGVGRRTGCATV